jgi:biopolymer transport protein ExbD
VKLERRPIRAEIPTTPMADLAFLLMMFFMVTTVFSTAKGLEFRLPAEQAQDPSLAGEATFIHINPDSSIVVDCMPMETDEILDYLEPRLTLNPETAVVLYADPYAPYQAMIAVYDALAAAENERGFKVQNVSVPTQTEVQEYFVLFGVDPFEARCGD